MKKTLLLMIALTLGLGLRAQCPLTTAVDFTATDVHGTEVHLFDILENGQYVLIDFFYTTCGPCQNACPKVVEAYSALGCNMHDVFFMEIDHGDNEATCLTWVNNYNVEYPTIAGTSGGTTICSQYGISAYPTVILIAPDHSIVIQDLWPINNAQTIITALAGYGIEQHDCTGGNDPAVTITIDQVLETEITATFTPNEECTTYYYLVATEDELNTWIASTGNDLAHVIQQFGMPADYEISQTFMDLSPNVEYAVSAVPADANGNLYDVVKEYVTTGSGSGGEIAPDFTATDIDGNEIHLYNILDGGQAVLINLFLIDDVSPSIMPYMTETYTYFGCNAHDVFYMEVNPMQGDDQCRTWAETYGVKYPTISRAGGGNDIAQAFMVGFYPTVMLILPDHTIAIPDLYPIESAQTIINALEGEGMEQHECDGVSVSETDDMLVSLYPNPADGFVTLTGESLGTVRVYNALGQEVAELQSEGSELKINTSRYENGVYFVKIGEQTLRFVVTH